MDVIGIFMTRVKEIDVNFVGLKSGCNWDFMTRVKEIDVRQDLSRRS